MSEPFAFPRAARTRGRFDLYMSMRGEEVTCFDLEIDESRDLRDDDSFNPIIEDIRCGRYDREGLLAPPGSTSAGARRAGDGGPPPLRSAAPPGLYGLPGLRPANTRSCGSAPCALAGAWPSLRPSKSARMSGSLFDG